LIFDGKTGQKLLEWSNKHEINKEKPNKIRVIGFLVNEKVDHDDNAEMRKRGEESEYGNEDDEESS